MFDLIYYTYIFSLVFFILKTSVTFNFYKLDNLTGNQETSLAMLILRGPLEMIGGVLFSLLIGAVLWKIPSSKNRVCAIIKHV